MTVKELIAELQRMPQDLEIAGDLHSDYGPVTSVRLIALFNNGGYLSAPYRDQDRPLTKDWVYIGDTTSAK